MVQTVEQRKEIFSKYGISPNDTGSAEVQVAHITARLEYLQSHFKANHKDNHSRRGLLKLVGRRRRLLDYIKGKDVQKYKSLISDLGIRR